MEANKAEGLRCIELAEKAILTGDHDRAIRFLSKSLELYPTQNAKDLLERLMYTNTQSSSNNDTDQPQTNGHGTSSTTTRQRTSSTRSHPNTHNNTNTHSTTTSNDYTSEEVEAVRKIKTCKDLYEILGVPKTASDADLKKAYRKLALQFHPDKCKAPGATDAFKAIGKAFAILSDAKKREQYDLYGTSMEAPSYSQNRRNGRSQQAYYFEDDDDFSAEEIFNLFFGYTGPTNRVYRRRQPNTFHFTTHSSSTTTTQNTSHTIAQILPYLFLFLISILGTLFVTDPQFMLHRTGKFVIPRTTHPHGVQYFVKQDFPKTPRPHELEKLEAAVLEEYVSDLKNQCYREQQYRESMIWRARMLGDKGLLLQAQGERTPSCDKLNEFLRARG
ncbi:unnamed protein product [Didymodactylos carnosus]|uniref:J domain-containing protein n=1 Tax=Didymodactylos carnosus TaxID=1234261 RepID=A0A8S2DB11_9BILA|nr:unnamed protein product [Didymodactylos carnosus]CAF3698183.1 unnamed protein product [Didymodactylos carnosus]